jgi:hypothetical protein
VPNDDDDDDDDDNADNDAADDNDDDDDNDNGDDDDDNDNDDNDDDDDDDDDVLYSIDCEDGIEKLYSLEHNMRDQQAQSICGDCRAAASPEILSEINLNM